MEQWTFGQSPLGDEALKRARGARVVPVASDSKNVRWRRACRLGWARMRSREFTWNSTWTPRMAPINTTTVGKLQLTGT